MVAFVGRSWAVYVGVGVLWALVIWAIPLLSVLDALPMAPGPILGTGIVTGGIAFGVWYLCLRGRLEVGDDGLVLSSRFRSRVFPWADLAVIEPSWRWQWVRCRDASGRVTIRLTTSRPYPRAHQLVSQHNEELATRLWYASRPPTESRPSA